MFGRNFPLVKISSISLLGPRNFFIISGFLCFEMKCDVIVHPILLSIHTLHNIQIQYLKNYDYYLVGTFSQVSLGTMLYITNRRDRIRIILFWISDLKEIHTITITTLTNSSWWNNSQIGLLTLNHRHTYAVHSQKNTNQTDSDGTMNFLFQWFFFLFLCLFIQCFFHFIPIICMYSELEFC